MIRSSPLAALALLWTAAAASAQIPTSTSDRVTPSSPGRGEAARMDPIFRRTVACVVERLPQRTRNLLDTIPGTAAETTIMNSFQSRLDWCYIPVEGGIGFTTNLLRGGVAEAYYHRAFPNGLPREPAGDAERAAAWSEPRPNGGTVNQIEMLHATARCVVVRKPGPVSDMLAAPPLGADEMRRMRALQGDVSACLDAGIEFTASRQSLRGLLAEAAFHYGNAFRQAAAAAARSD